MHLILPNAVGYIVFDPDLLSILLELLSPLEVDPIFLDGLRWQELKEIPAVFIIDDRDTDFVLEAYEAIRHVRSKVEYKLAFFTLLSSETDPVQAIEGGFDDVFTLPFDARLFQKTILRRIEHVARSMYNVSKQPFVVGDYLIDPRFLDAFYLPTRRLLELKVGEFNFLNTALTFNGWWSWSLMARLLGMKNPQSLSYLIRSLQKNFPINDYIYCKHYPGRYIKICRAKMEPKFITPEEADKIISSKPKPKYRT